MKEGLILEATSSCWPHSFQEEKGHTRQSLSPPTLAGKEVLRRQRAARIRRGYIAGESWLCPWLFSLAWPLFHWESQEKLCWAMIGTHRVGTVYLGMEICWGLYGRKQNLGREVGPEEAELLPGSASLRQGRVASGPPPVGCLHLTACVWSGAWEGPVLGTPV